MSDGVDVPSLATSPRFFFNFSLNMIKRVWPASWGTLKTMVKNHAPPASSKMAEKIHIYTYILKKAIKGHNWHSLHDPLQRMHWFYLINDTQTWLFGSPGWWGTTLSLWVKRWVRVMIVKSFKLGPSPAKKRCSTPKLMKCNMFCSQTLNHNLVQLSHQSLASSPLV